MSIIIVLVQRYANRNAEYGSDEKAELSANSQPSEQVIDASAESQPDELTPEPFLSLLPHLHKIIALLHNSVPDKTAAQFGKFVPFGETRMKVVELSLVLLRSHLSVVDNKMMELNVIAIMIDMFFAHPWNNMLHGLVESIIRSIMESESAQLKVHVSAHMQSVYCCRDLCISCVVLLPLSFDICFVVCFATLVQLFREAHFVEKFVEGFRRNEEVCRAGFGYRLGYMGHLIRTASIVEEIIKKGAFMPNETEESARAVLMTPELSKMWSDFISNQIEPETSKQKSNAPFMQGAPT